MKYSITNRPTLLANDDEVLFELKGRTLEARVFPEFLNLSCVKNHEIFNILGIDKVELASASYGYQPIGGDWPQSREGDFPALTRLVNSIFERISKLPEDERKGAPEEEKPAEYTIENRPKLLKYADRVIFVVDGKEMIHDVVRDRLNYRAGMDKEIFDTLRLDRFGFAHVAYGYEPREFCFPKWRADDYQAATNLVNALFDVIEGRGKKEEPAPELKFKIGDRVKISDAGHAKYGDGDMNPRGVFGTVIQPIPHQWPYRVQFDNGNANSYEHDEDLELAPAAPARKFKVGDRVMVNGTWPGTIIEGSRGAWAYLVLPEDGSEPSGYGCHESNLELAPAAEEAPAATSRKFRVKDRVRALEGSGVEPGMKGEIVEDDGGDEDRGSPYRVRFDNGRDSIVWFNAEDLELIPEGEDESASKIDAVLASIQIPEGFRDHVREILVNLPKARSFVAGISAREGETFGGARIALYASQHDEGADLLDHVGLARMIQVQAESRIASERLES